MSFRISVVFVETWWCKMYLAFANTANQCMVIANEILLICACLERKSILFELVRNLCAIFYFPFEGTERDKEVSRWSQKITYRACKVPGCTEKKADSLAVSQILRLQMRNNVLLNLLLCILQDFKRHVVSSHGIKISAYIDMYCPSEGIVDTMVYHACLICQKSIMHGKHHKYLFRFLVFSYIMRTIVLISFSFN